MRNKSLLNEEEKEIALHNIIEVIETLKIMNRAKKFLKEAGLGTSQYHYWRQGIVEPRITSIKKICKKLGIDTEVFIHKKLEIEVKFDIKFED